MIFGRKKPKRLYYPTQSDWYRKPRQRKDLKVSRKIFSHNIRTHFTRFVKDAFFYVTVGGLFLTLLIFLIFSGRFSIQKIDIARDDLHINSTAVADVLALFKGKSIFTFSKTKAKQLVQEKYPEFSRVEITKVLPNTLKVELKTYDIVANMRAFYTLPRIEKTPEVSEESEITSIDEALKTAFDIKSNTKTEEREEVTPIEQKALLNEVGQAIFDREEDLELMTITVDGLSQPVEDREIVIPRESMDYILNAVKYLSNLMQFEIVSIRFFPAAREVHLKASNNLILWLATNKDYKEQIDKLHTIYKVAELDKEDLAYIDLRIREKIIYCPRHSSCDR